MGSKYIVTMCRVVVRIKWGLLRVACIADCLAYEQLPNERRNANKDSCGPFCSQILQRFCQPSCGLDMRHSLSFRIYWNVASREVALKCLHLWLSLCQAAPPASMPWALTSPGLYLALLFALSPVSLHLYLQLITLQDLSVALRWHPKTTGESLPKYTRHILSEHLPSSVSLPTWEFL